MITTTSLQLLPKRISPRWKTVTGGGLGGNVTKRLMSQTNPELWPLLGIVSGIPFRSNQCFIFCDPPHEKILG